MRKEAVSAGDALLADRNQRESPRPPAIALLIWNTVLEDFLDPLGVSLEEFCRDFRGSWVLDTLPRCRRPGYEASSFARRSGWQNLRASLTDRPARGSGSFRHHAYTARCIGGWSTRMVKPFVRHSATFAAAVASCFRSMAAREKLRCTSRRRCGRSPRSFARKGARRSCARSTSTHASTSACCSER